MNFFDNRVVLQRRVKISLTADDWQLYHRPGRERAAASINRAIERAVAEASNRNSAYHLSMAALRTQASLGAYDTEGIVTLDALLNHIYGEQQ